MRQEVNKILKLGANTKLVRKSIQEETEKVILRKDLNNIVTAFSSPSRNNIETTVTKLKEKYGKAS